MNRILGILLLSVYLIALIGPIAPYIEYAINKDFIVKVLCINRDTPKLNCNGKCYLNSQLKKVNEINHSDKQPIPPKIELEKYPIDFVQESKYPGKQPGFARNVSFPN